MSSDHYVLRAKAEAALDLMLMDRKAAAASASAVIDAESGDPIAESMAHRVLASVFTHRGRLSDAATHADHAVECAETAADDELLGGALLTRMGVLITTGAVEDAISDSYRAEPLLPATGLVRLLIQRGTALGLGLGRVDEAIETFDQIERDHPDLEPIVEAVLTMNRGTQLMARGDHHRALADFETARTRYRELGNVESECDVLLNKAQLAAHIGDFPTVFALQAEVEERNLLAATDHRTANDLADALLHAGLRREAEAMSQRALDLVVDDTTTAAAAEAVLRIAELRLLFGDHAEAQRLGSHVAAWAKTRAIEGLAARADLVLVRTAIALGGGYEAVPELVGVAQRLDQQGRAEDAADARIEAATLCIDHGETGGVEAILGTIRPPDDSDPSKPEIARWSHAQALRHVAAGQPGQAMRHLSKGLDALDSMRSAIAAMDVRAAAVDRGAELAQLGVTLAASSRRTRRLLEWSERQRAVALRLTTAVRSPAAESNLAEIRKRSTRKEVIGPADAVSLAMRSERQSVAENTRLDAGTIVDAVGDRALVEFVQLGEWLHAIVIHRGRVRHWPDLARVDEVDAAVERIDFGLRRTGNRLEARAAAAMALVVGVAAQLDRLLLRCVPSGAREVVLVPSGRLHLLPWSVLPSLAGRSFSVSPSAHLWHKAATQPPRPGPVALLHGPDLPHAPDEIRLIAERYGHGTQGAIATVDATTGAMSAARLLHLAAHGTFRNDNAQFSSLWLHDGPLFVHDLDSLDRLPDVIILSACNVGTVNVLRGNEVLGFPAAMLARGAASVIAAMIPVEDAAVRDLMVEVHGHLVRGSSPSVALTAASGAVVGRSPHHFAAAHGFVTYGLG